jgi:hypothetical protein
MLCFALPVLSLLCEMLLSVEKELCRGDGLTHFDGGCIKLRGRQRDNEKAKELDS